MLVSVLADYPHYAKQIAEWYFSEWGSLVPGSTLESVENKVKERAVQGEHIPFGLVVHHQGELLAAADLKFRENTNYPEYEHWLGGVYVNPSYRGQGITRLLIERAKSEANRLGVEQLYLQCESHNIALYQKYGFTPLHTAKHHEADTTIMVWQAVNVDESNVSER